VQAHAHRSLLRLSASYALAWAAVSMVAGPGSAALVRLSGHLALSGGFIGLFYVGAAVGAGLLGRAMDRFRPPAALAASHIVAAAGFALAGLGVAVDLLPAFLAGTLLLAFGFGGVNLSRVAAATLVGPAERGRAVAWVQWSATLGAVVGPLLLILSGPLGQAIGRDPLSLVWTFAPPLLLAGAFLAGGSAVASTVPSPGPSPVPGNGGPPSPAPPVPGRALAAGFVSLAAALAAMAAVMGVAGAAVQYAGHGATVLGGLMLLHFLGMFGFSRVVGRTADRFGRRATVLLGLAGSGLGGLVVALDVGAWGFGAGLFIVGLGWSFAFLGATVLLTDLAPPGRSARTLGRADLVAQLSAAAVAGGAGWWFARAGIEGLGLFAALLVVVPALLVARLREPIPGQYGEAPAAV